MIDVGRAKEEQGGRQRRQAAAAGQAHHGEGDQAQAGCGDADQQAARPERRPHQGDQRADHGLEQRRVVGEDVRVAVDVLVDAQSVGNALRLVEHQALAIVELEGVAEAEDMDVDGLQQVEHEPCQGHEPEHTHWLSLAAQL